MAALKRSGLLRHQQHERLVRICYTAVELIGADCSQLNVITATQQVFIAEWPRTAQRSPVELDNSGCSEVIALGGLLAVEDTLAHPVMCIMPWTAHWQGYLGAPITYEGQAIGSLCTLSVNKRAWSKHDQLTIQTLADMVTAAISHL